MTRLLASLTILRKTHGCELPAEIFGFSHELEDLGSVRDEFEALGDVNFRTITCKPKEKQWKQFQIVSFDCPSLLTIELGSDNCYSGLSERRSHCQVILYRSSLS